MVVTIWDIAKYLDLSISTVSRALNGYDDVAEKTRQRVFAAAAELGYYPSAAARDLRRRKTDRIGFLYGYASADIGEYASRIINGAVSAAEKAGYNVLLYPLTGNQIQKLSRICQTREVDGLLLMGGAYLDESISLLQQSQIPFVVLNRQFEQPDVAFVSSDHHSATVMALHHLIELGHTRIAYMGQAALEQLHDGRVASYKQTLHEANFEVDASLMVSAGTNPGDGYQVMQTLLALPEPPTAVLTIHDPLAIECLQATTAAGLRVPDDIAIMGSDNLRETQVTKPPLTTIHPPLAEVGRQAMTGLLQQLADRNAPLTRLSLPVKLVVRQSTVGAME
ncbi:LacI family DNA-binding transcriptional regulator [Candidatus Leptofilum sp.]|uniref:LacI family DNA-binding transcriptional regulator n=1 Tax=Candidatus Leptofilum sp. TaxID=3241576 RepID=UPI003B5C492F